MTDMATCYKRLLSLLDDQNMGILDGGLATYLEDGLGFDLSLGPLWSARLLDEKEPDVYNGKGQKGILDAHRHYLQAGAQIIGTATYQASVESFSCAGYSQDQAERLMFKAIDLAYQAIEVSRRNEKALICLSLGSYGSMLANGAEYTGDYRPTYLTDEARNDQQPLFQELVSFHKRRLETFVNNQKVYEKIDLIALETVPRLDEAKAFRCALNSLRAVAKPVYISFVFTHPDHLPWTGTVSNTQENQWQQMMQVLFAPTTPDDDHHHHHSWPIAGIGINCTKPYMMASIVAKLTEALEALDENVWVQRAKAGWEKPLLFLYPDGGLVYDAVKKRWHQPLATEASTSASWAQGLFKIAQSVAPNNCEQGRPSGVWRGIFIGGCCKSGTQEIEALAQCVRK